jgi:hypothetical protein
VGFKNSLCNTDLCYVCFLQYIILHKFLTMLSFEAKLNCNIAIYFSFHFQQITVNYSCFLVTYVKEIKMLCKLLFFFLNMYMLCLKRNIMKSYSQLAENNKLIGRAAICITFLFPLRK